MLFAVVDKLVDLFLLDSRLEMISKVIIKLLLRFIVHYSCIILKCLNCTVYPVAVIGKRSFENIEFSWRFHRLCIQPNIISKPNRSNSNLILIGDEAPVVLDLLGVF